MDLVFYKLKDAISKIQVLVILLDCKISIEKEVNLVLPNAVCGIYNVGNLGSHTQ